MPSDGEQAKVMVWAREMVFAPPAGLDVGASLFTLTHAPGLGWTRDFDAAVRACRDGATRTGKGSYSYTQFRVDLWVLSCIGGMASLQGAFISANPINTHLAILLAALYAALCLVVSHEMLLHLGVRGFPRAGNSRSPMPRVAPV